MNKGYNFNPSYHNFKGGWYFDSFEKTFKIVLFFKTFSAFHNFLHLFHAFDFGLIFDFRLILGEL